MTAAKIRPTVIGTATFAIAAISAAPAVAAPTATYVWTGAAGEGTDWLNVNNWLVNGDIPAKGPDHQMYEVLFDRSFSLQPRLPGPNGTQLSLAGIRVSGTDVGEIYIDNVGGSRTIQLYGNLNPTAGTSVLIESGTTGKLTVANSSFKLGHNNSVWINDSAQIFTVLAAVNMEGRSLTVTGTGDTLISGTISNGHATNKATLIKDGSGTLTLANGTNAHSGTTTIKSGTLLVTGGLGSSGNTTDPAVVIAEGGTLGGTGSIYRITTIQENATLAPGIDDATAGTLTLRRSLTLGGTIDFDIQSASEHDVLNLSTAVSGTVLTFGGTLKVDAGPDVTFFDGQKFKLFNWNANVTFVDAFTSFQLPTLPTGLQWKTFDGQPFNYATGEIEVTVPEPAGIALVGGSLMLLLRRRRR